MTDKPKRRSPPRQATPELVQDARATLGESPVWDDRSDALWWIDCAEARLHRYAPGTGRTAHWDLPDRPGSMALADSGQVLLALGPDIVLFDTASGAISELCRPLAGQAHLRFNDGKCDPQGRFWVGSMNTDYRTPEGCLLRIDGDGLSMQDAGFRVPNGPAWSPEGDRFVVGCSASDTIYAYDFEPAAGTLSGKRIWAGPKTAPGYPDGAAMDAEGCLWSARWDGGCVARLTPDGRLDRVIDLPCRRVTSCAFGGPGRQTLFITTARIGLDTAVRAEEPLAGGLFAVDAGVAGAPVARFGARSSP